MMRALPVSTAAVLCPAMLLFTLLANPTTVALNNTSTPCAPASCGDLTVTYPFWLAGTHPPECGYRAFQVMCDKGNASLENSFWTYQILDIFYENSSFRVTNVQLSGGACSFDMSFNASSDLGLAPFKISSRNQELFFVYCDSWAPPLPRSWAPVSCANDSSKSFAWLAGMYKPDDRWKPLPMPGNCNVSMMPVLGYEGATGVDYQQLMTGGFLLDFTSDYCSFCIETGGQCRTNVTEDVLECHCSDGVYPVICGDSG